MLTKERDIENKEILLKRFQVRNSGRVDGEGEEGAAMFDGKSLKK